MAMNILVSPEQLELTAKKTSKHAKEYKYLVDRIYSETKGLNTTWTGKDNTDFIKAIGSFKTDFVKMNTLMEMYADYLMTCARSYQITQESIQLEAKKLLEW